jgi:hypothetical protein
MDHFDERRLINLRGNLDSAIRSVGDGADAAFLLRMEPESGKLRLVHESLKKILVDVEQRLSR